MPVTISPTGGHHSGLRIEPLNPPPIQRTLRSMMWNFDDGRRLYQWMVDQSRQGFDFRIGRQQNRVLVAR